MAKKFLFVTLAIAFAFGMMVSGCETADKDGFENHTINLTPAEESNAILLTLKGATWKDLTLDLDDLANAGEQKARQVALLENLLEWNQKDGSISSLTKNIESEFKLEKKNVLKITFSKLGAFSAGFTGSGEVSINKYSSPKLMAALELFTDDMDQLAYWTIGKNKPVTITIK